MTTPEQALEDELAQQLLVLMPWPVTLSELGAQEWARRAAQTIFSALAWKIIELYCPSRYSDAISEAGLQL